MTVHEDRPARQGSQRCPCVPGVERPCAGFVECSAVGDLAALVDDAATRSGLAPQEVLAGISDEALAALYLSCAAQVRRAATAEPDVLRDR